MTFKRSVITGLLVGIFCVSAHAVLPKSVFQFEELDVVVEDGTPFNKDVVKSLAFQADQAGLTRTYTLSSVSPLMLATIYDEFLIPQAEKKKSTQALLGCTTMVGTQMTLSPCTNVHRNNTYVMLTALNGRCIGEVLWAMPSRNNTAKAVTVGNLKCSKAPTEFVHILRTYARYKD